jgi:hypothetical protein
MIWHVRKNGECGNPDLQYSVFRQTRQKTGTLIFDDIKKLVCRYSPECIGTIQSNQKRMGE